MPELVINGELSGLYALTEQIDENFIRQNLMIQVAIYIKKYGHLLTKRITIAQNSIIKAQDKQGYKYQH